MSAGGPPAATRPSAPESGPTTPAITSVTPSGVTRQHELEGHLVHVIGRDGDCSIQVADDSVSRRHAELRVTPLAVRDLRSTNGTRVQGRPVGTEWMPVMIGSVIEVGDAVLLVRDARAQVQPTWTPIKRADRPALSGVIAVSAAMQELCRLVQLVAPSPIGVLLVGETGAGKEVIAQALHQSSPRAGRIIAINCAALAPSLLEAELFGYEKGAFTGATQTKIGLFEAADKGTLFLDEVGELPLEMQAKLLRVIETGEVTRVGAVAPVRIDTRVVAATHRDLMAMTHAGTFRLDLLFRIAGITLAIPPLRERRDDILALAAHFLPADAPPLSPAARRALEAHAWPGNVRELRSTIQRAVLLAGGAPIEPAHLAFGTGVPIGTDHVPHAAAGELTERERIEAALRVAAGNQSRAAKALGISRATLVRRLTEFGLARPRK